MLSSMERIAVCFNGQLRTAVEASPSIKHYFGDNFDKVDFFVHTWTQNSFRPPFNLKVPAKKDTFVTKEYVDQFLKIYNPVNIILEDSEKYYSRITKTYGSTGDLVSFWHSGYYSSLLKREFEKLNNFKYDVVLRLRTDLIFPTDRYFENDLENFNKNRNSFYFHNLFGDTLQMGSSDTMDTALDFYREGEFYGNHFWPMNKFIEYLTSKNIVAERLDDNRISILRPGFEYIDPLNYYYELSMINSMMFENINFAKESHFCTFENSNNPDWYENSKNQIVQMFHSDRDTVEKYFEYFRNL